MERSVRNAQDEIDSDIANGLLARRRTKAGRY